MLLKKKIILVVFAVVCVVIGHQYLQADITSDLAGHWKFNDGTGIIAVDSSSEGNDGTLTGSTTAAWIAGGQIGGALSFDGTTTEQKVFVGNPSSNVLSIGSSTDFTISVWFNQNGATNTSRHLVSKYNANDNKGYYLGIAGNNGNRPAFFFNDEFGNSCFVQNGSGGPTAPETGWHHMVGVFSEDASSTTAVYFDGQEIISAEDVGCVMSNYGDIAIGSNYNFVIGAKHKFDGSYEQIFDGYLDDVRVYRRAFSSSEVTELYQDGLKDVPSVETNAASAINKTVATLNGTITNNNFASSTERGFVYGTTTTYGATTSEIGTFDTGGFARNLTGLASSTTYYFRAFAGNSEGVAYGASSTFVTYGDLPTISGVGSVPSFMGATISWTTDIPSDSQVEYGLTDTYGSSTIIDASQVINHSMQLTGLNASTTYHYRVISNGATSSDATFMTTNTENAITQSMFYTEPGVHIGSFISDGVTHYRIAEPYDGYYATATSLQIANQSWIESDNTFFGDGTGGASSLAVNGSAIRLATSTGSYISFDFEDLRQGTYFIRVVGRTDGAVTRIRKPVLLNFTINDGPNGEVNTYQIRTLYSNYLEDTGRLFFNALNTSNDLQATLSLATSSAEDLLVHRIDFFDPIGVAPSKVKTEATTFTSAEQAFIQANPPSELPTLPVIPIGLTDQDRIDRDDVIWNALPRINTMHTADGIDGPYQDVWPNGMTTAENEALYGSWELDTRHATSQTFNQIYDYDMPWRLVNRDLGLTYTLDDYYNQRCLPDPYPFKDCGTGVYFATSTYGSPGTYQFIIGSAMRTRMQLQYSGALSGAIQSGLGDGGADIAYRYYINGDYDTAWDAALTLVRFAQTWPARQMEVQGLAYNAANPDLEFGGDFRWRTARLGKIYYSGWTAFVLEGYLKSYDYLYDFIDGNQDFADAVNRYVPWVTTPDDVIALIDTYLVRTTYNDVVAQRTNTEVPLLPGLIFQNGSLAASIMNIAETLTQNTPAGIGTIKQLYHSAYSQDGIDFIGSIGYITSSEKIISDADSIDRYQNNTATSLDFDLTDINAFPKLRSYANTLADLLVAGGYEPSYGDSGGDLNQPRRISRLLDLFQTAWRYGGKNTKLAWYLVNEIGRTNEIDGEWSEITTGANTEGADPRLTSESRTFNGLGLGILETGTENDYREKSAIVVRTGEGSGHAHGDALDLGWFSLGLRMGTDYAERNEGSNIVVPDAGLSRMHNVVEVDGWNNPRNAGNGWPAGNFGESGAWIETFAPGEESQYIATAATSSNHTNLEVFKRNTALVDIDDTTAYIFDVFRVAGGQWYSWNFHGANTGGESGGMTINTAMSTTLDSDATQYLKKFANGSTKQQGTAPDKLEITWRLSRTNTADTFTNGDGVTLDASNVAAEQALLGGDYDAVSDRKYTKISLFDRAGDMVMAGTAYSDSYDVIQPNILVATGTGGVYDPDVHATDEVYPAIIEAYEGVSQITESASLTVVPNETDALRAVALVATTTAGNVDTLISDGRTISRTVGDIEYNGLFAHYQHATSGEFNMMKLVGGTELARGDYAIYPVVGVASTTITAVDYEAQEIYTADPFDTSLAGRDFFIYNDTHKTAYTIIDIADSGSGSVLTFKNPADIGEIAVDDYTNGTLESSDTWALSTFENRKSGLTGTNESGSKHFKIDGLSGKYEYSVTPEDTLMESNFTDADNDGTNQAIIYDFGFSDTIEIASNVSLRATGTLYEIDTDVDTNVSLPANGDNTIQVSSDASNWTNLTTTESNGILIATVSSSLNTQYLRTETQSSSSGGSSGGSSRSSSGGGGGGSGGSSSDSSTTSTASTNDGVENGTSSNEELIIQIIKAMIAVIQKIIVLMLAGQN